MKLLQVYFVCHLSVQIEKLYIFKKNIPMPALQEIQSGQNNARFSIASFVRARPC